MFNQPKGVLSLAGAEMWERFSFYTMQSILVLYVGASLTNGGLGWTPENALLITGLYGGAVYMTPVLGGFIASHYLGSRKSVAIGAILMCIGQFILAIKSEFAFFTSMIFLCIGCGLLKPCITTLVGTCYSPGDQRRASGFSIFYMAINVGGFMGPLIGGALSEKYGFYMAFLCAGAGLIVGLFNFYLACRNMPPEQMEHLKKDGIPRPVLTSNEKLRMKIFVSMCVANIAWNVVYGLPAGLLTLYAEKNIDRNILGFQVPTSWFYGLNPIFIILLSPLLGSFYNFLARRNVNFTLSYKLATGYLTVALACLIFLPSVIQIAHTPQVLVGPLGLVIFYAVYSLSELLTIPVLLSAATELAPPHYVAKMVSVNMLVSWCLGNWISGYVSSLTINVGAISLFVVLIIVCTLFGVIHLLSNRKIESLCAGKETDADIQPFEPKLEYVLAQKSEG